MSNKKFFTSDWHLGDDRIGVNGKPNLFYRPFKSLLDQHLSILDGLVTSMSNTPEHTLYHLGDVVVGDSPSSIRFLRLIRNKYSKTKWVLVKGNYDDDRTDIHQYFDEIYESDTYTDVGGYNVYLNHYPTKVVDAFNHSLNPYDFGLTGHIHGLWKVQKNMINVGVDAWHFRPVSEDEILFCWNAMQNHYDMNVFPY